MSTQLTTMSEEVKEVGVAGVAGQARGHATDPSVWVDAHGDYLYRYALMRVRDTAVAEDLVQETLLAALQSRHAYAGRSAERTWLTGILKHKLVDHFRRASRLAYSSQPEGEEFEHDELFRSVAAASNLARTHADCLSEGQQSKG